MKKNSPKQYPNDEKMGPIDKLGGMVNRRSTRKGIPAKTSTSTKRHDEEALLDQIDKQVGQLLLKSSDIESKLDSIEGVKRRKYQQTTFSTSTTKKTGSKQAKKTKTSTATISNYQQPQNADFQALFELVQSLAEEVRIMHEEQTEMREQINQLQELLIAEAEEEEDRSD